MVDRIQTLDPGAGYVRAECLVPERSPVFEGHFPGYPILPGVLMIEAMAQTGGWLVIGSRRFSRMAFLAQVKQAKLRAVIEPGQHIGVEARLLHDGSGYAVASGRIEVGGREVAEAEITYRVVPFPHETLRREMIAAARRIAVPEALLDAA